MTKESEQLDAAVNARRYLSAGGTNPSVAMLHNLLAAYERVEAREEELSRAWDRENELRHEAEQRVTEFEESYTPCQTHQPEAWESDGSCPICEGTALKARVTALEAERDEAELRYRIEHNTVADLAISATKQTMRAERAEDRVTALEAALRGMLDQPESPESYDAMLERAQAALKGASDGE